VLEIMRIAGIQQCMPEALCLILKAGKGYDMEIASNHHTGLKKIT